MGIIEKKEALAAYMLKATGENVCLAFSGGVDSSLLLYTACEAAKVNHTSVHAVLFSTTLHPMGDAEVAKRIAKRAGAVFHVIPVDEYSEIAELKGNPANRCYLCKRHLFTKLKSYARDRKISVIMDGTNLDDRSAFRPGIRALRELKIESPLAALGITKEEVRTLARDYDLEVASRPSAPCLATRLPYGACLDEEVLHAIDAGERFLKELGFAVVRIRKHGDVVRIEIPPSEFEQLIRQKDVVIAHLKALGFIYITLDLMGFRSGSMDEVLGDEEKDAINNG